MVWLSPRGSPKEGRAGAVGNKCLIIGLIIIPGGIDKQENKPARRRIRTHSRRRTLAQTNKHDAAQTPAAWQYGESWCVNYFYIVFSQQGANCDLTLWCVLTVIDFFERSRGILGRLWRVYEILKEIALKRFFERVTNEILFEISNMS